MDWNAIGAVGEILGALGVIVTLGYLSIQIRQNTKVARASTRTAIAESAQALTQDYLQDREIAEIFVKHLNGEHLNAVERFRLNGRCYRDFRHWENIHYQLREGMLLEEEWSGFRNNLAALFEIEVYRDYWNAEYGLYGDSFREEVEKILAEVGDSTSVKIASRFRYTNDE